MSKRQRMVRQSLRNRDPVWNKKLLAELLIKTLKRMTEPTEAAKHGKAG